MDTLQIPSIERYTTQKTTAQSEYQDLIAQAAKMTGQPFIVMHKRVERAFGAAPLTVVMSYVRQWVHEASKDRKPAVCFNYRFKQFREAQVAAAQK